MRIVGNLVKLTVGSAYPHVSLDILVHADVVAVLAAGVLVGSAFGVLPCVVSISLLATPFKPRHIF